MEDIINFLDIKEAPGESKVKGFEGQIAISSFGWGGSNASTMGEVSGASAGRFQLQSISISASLDKGTSKMGQLFGQGKTLSSAILTSVKQANETTNAYYTATLSDVRISNFNVSVGSAGLPYVNITLVYDKLDLEYKMQSAEGTFTSATKYKFDVNAGTVA